MGTPEFAREFLEHIYINKNFNIKAVYTQSSKKAHRGQKINSSSVYKFAKEKIIIDDKKIAIYQKTFFEIIFLFLKFFSIKK